MPANVVAVLHVSGEILLQFPEPPDLVLMLRLRQSALGWQDTQGLYPCVQLGIGMTFARFGTAGE